MNWLVVALVTPFAHAIVNHLDKLLIQRYLKGGEVGSLVLFSALFAVVALPLIGWFAPESFAVSSRDALILIVNGALIVLAYICYFYALNQDETSFVVPLFQLVPVFGFVIGYVVLGEALSPAQLLGSIIVIAGAVILSLQLSNGRIRLKQTVLWLMAASSLLYAVNGVLFKFVAETQQHFWPSVFWDFVGKVIFGLLLFALVGSYRRQFLAVIKENRASILSLNAFNELLALLGEGAFVFAILLAPVVLVQVVNSFQPMFVFMFGLLFTYLARFSPFFLKESVTKRNLIQKVIGIAVMLVGTLILSRYT